MSPKSSKRKPLKRVTAFKKTRILPELKSTKVRGLDRALLLVLRTLLTLLMFGFVFLAGAIVALACIASLVGVLYLRQISVHAMQSPSQILSTVLSVRKTQVVQTDGRKNILVLGTDALANRDEKSLLTDSLMILSIEASSGVIRTFSFPRDLYIASHSAKINSLYEKGMTLSPSEPELIVKQTIQDISGIPIHNVLVMDIATVGKIIDALGGLDIDIENSFVDYRFPRSDVDVRIERDPNKLYEVVAFSKGREHMSGDRALRFMRSRHSMDPLEGSDDGRIKRQQRVIAALLEQLKDPMLIRNPEQLGKLMKIYTDSFDHSLSLSELTAMGYTMIKDGKTPTFRSYQFPIDTGIDSVITHPNRHASGAWVYLPTDPTYNQMKQTVASWLSL